MQVTPPAGGAPSQPQGPGGQPGPAEQAIMMIQKGFQMLAKLMQSAGDKIGEDDMKLFQVAVQATDTFIQALVGGEGGEGEAPEPGPGKPPAKAPMPMNANAGAKPAPQY